MARSYLEELRLLIQAQTTRLGSPVANLFGAAKGALRSTSEAVRSSWLGLQLPARQYESIEAFYEGLAATPKPARAVYETDTGAVLIPSPTVEPATILAKGAVTLEHQRSFRLAVDVGSPQGTFMVAVDGRVVRQGTGAAEIRVSLTAGEHLLEVLAVSRVLAIKVPPDLKVEAAIDVVRPPVWKSLTTGYLDEALGTTQVTASWYVDPRAGGWRVLRRQLQRVATIEDVGPADPAGRFTIVLTGDQVAVLPAGATCYAGVEAMGVLLSASYDATALKTNAELRLATDLTETASRWVGRAATTGEFVEVARVARTAAGGWTAWQDTAVKFGEYYEYALQAYGAHDPSSWSLFSDVRRTHAGDTAAPGPIVLALNYPKVIDKQARVRFTTPADDDYAGVRVYYRQQHTGTATAGTTTTLTDSGAAFPSAGSPAGWFVRLVSGTGAGQEREVAAWTPTQITPDGDWITAPDNTTEYLVYRDEVLKTDFGLAGAADEFTFTPVDTDTGGFTQLYHFRTFDLSGNEQTDWDCETWLYDPDDNVMSGAPYATLLVEVSSQTATTQTVKVTATAPVEFDAPQVRWNFTNGTTNKVAGANLGVLVVSGSEWTFERPQNIAGVYAQVGFEAVITGLVSDADFHTINPIGVDGSALGVLCKDAGSTATEQVVDVTVTAPNGATPSATLTVFDQSGIATTITPASTTQTVPFTQRYTIPRPDWGAANARVIFRASATGFVDDYDSIDIIAEDQDTRYTGCSAKIVNSTATQVVVQVTGDANTGTPQVEYVGVTGSATLVSCSVPAGATPGTKVASGTTWTFARGAINAGAGQAQFRSTLSGYEPDDAFVTLEEQGRDTVPLVIKAEVLNTYADRVVVRVRVADPYPQGTDTVTLSYTYPGCPAVTAPGVLTLTPTASLSSSPTKDFTIYRPAFQAGTGQFVVTATAANRLDAVDSVTVPSVEQDTQYVECRARIVSSTATQHVVQVDAVSISGTPQVEYVAVTGSATLVSCSVPAGATPGTKVASGTQWTFARGAALGGAGQAQFRGSLSGFQSDDDIVVLSEQGRDTVPLVVQAAQIGQSASTVTVRVKAIDPYPQGANTVTISYAAQNVAGVTPASGQTLTPTADFSTTGYCDFVISRGIYGSDPGSVLFTATAANRVADSDPVFVPTQDAAIVGPSLSVTSTPTSSTYTIAYTAIGTLTLSINGGAFAAPPASPFSVSRPAAAQPDATYLFRCVKDGLEVTKQVNVVAVDKSTNTPGLAAIAAGTTALTTAFNVSTATAATVTMTLTGCTAQGFSGAGPHTLTLPTTVVFNRPGAAAGNGSVTFNASITGGGSETITRVVQAVDTNLQATQCFTRIYSSTKDTVVVEVTATSPGGTPQVAYVASSGSAAAPTACVTSAGVNQPSGLTPNTYVGSGSRWTFARGAFQGGAGQAQFRARLTGLQDDDDFITIEEQGRDTVSLNVTAKITAQTSTQTTVSVTVEDPYPQGNGSITINAPSKSSSVGTVSPATAQVVNPGSATTYTITRPSAGTGDGSVTWTATAAGRVSDSDAVTVPEQPQAPGVTQCIATITSAVASQVTVTVTGTAVGGTPTVEFVGVTGDTAKASGPNAGVASPSGTTWNFSRGTFQGGGGTARFKSVLAGYSSDEDAITIPEQGRDTVLLRCRVTVIDTSNANKIKVRVLATDPLSSGMSLTVSHSASSGVTVNNSTDTGAAAASYGVTDGGTQDYWVYRPTGGGTMGRVVFTVSGTDRVSDTDSVDVAPVESTEPLLSVTPTSDDTNYYYAASSANGASITYRVDGGSATSYTTSVTVARNGAGGSARVIEFTATLNGKTKVLSFTAPPKDVAGSGKISGLSAWKDTPSAGNLQVNFSASGFPSGTTFTCYYDITDGSMGTQTGISSGSYWAVTFGAAGTAKVTVQAFDSGGAAIGAPISVWGALSI